MAATGFIDEVEQLLVEEMKAFMGCAEVETRCVSGQMSNTCVFSALMDWKNRLNRKLQRFGLPVAGGGGGVLLHGTVEDGAGEGGRSA